MTYPAGRKSPTFGELTCADCGVGVLKRGVAQKFCAECSQVRHVAVKRRSQETRGKQAYEERRARFADQGSALNLPHRLCIETSKPKPPKLIWYRRVAIPFSWAGSKNHIWASTSRGHTFMRDESRYYRGLISKAVLQGLSGQNIATNKLWIDIFAQKPKATGDAVNFVDIVCDAIKDVIPLDDKWYSIQSVDWQITKSDPQLFIGLGQESLVDVQACSSCGRLLSYDNFQKNRGLVNGIGRNCKDCQSAGRRRVKWSGGIFD